MCLILLSSVKGATLNWFYSLPLHSIHNFEEVINAFLTQYTSRREPKKNNYHLLFVKMRQEDSLKSYIGYFQSQLAKLPHCGEDVSSLVFNGLRLSPPIQHLLRHNVS